MCIRDSLVDIPEAKARPQGQRMGKPKRGTHSSAKRFAKDGVKDDAKPAPTGRGKFAHKPAKKNKSGGSGYGGGSSGGRKMNFKGDKGKPSGRPSGRRK